MGFFYKIKKIIQIIFDFFIPDYCCLCGKINFQDRNDEVNDALCEKCSKEILFFEHDEFEDNKKNIENIERIFSMGVYEGKLRELIIKFKYNKKVKIINYLIQQFNLKFAEFFKKEIKKTNGEFFIIPVPLHEARFNERGFNQAGIFADIISNNLDLKVSNAVKRVKNTKAQHNLSSTERIENLKNAFSLIPGAEKSLIGKNIIIIDDIITTGATLKSIAGLLKENGVNRIWCFSISRALIK